MKTLFPLVWTVLIFVLAVKLEAPLNVVDPSVEGFSAHNTLRHIEFMAAEAHFMGTEQNRKVKDYILSEFEAMDIPTEVFVGYSKAQFRSVAYKMARTENIIARIESPGAKKSIVFAGHYDSVLNSPGAADDVHSVACMLETARLLKDKEHKHNIVFLITDGEEMGLLGAQAFVETKDLDDIAILINYEARGNSGAGIFFEWSEGNESLVRHLKKVCRRPVSNSLAYEIYKLLPNDSDFTHFKRAGIRGVNHAFIDGFTYYHNPDDRAENLNMNSVQHTGENMWRMAEYFANLEFESEPGTKDASFFNFLGYLVIYPSSFDLILLIILSLLSIAVLYCYSKKEFRTTKLLLSTSYLILSVVLVIIASVLITYILSVAYPHYDVFYTGQYYNHKWYILVPVGLQIIAFYLLTGRMRSKGMLEELKVSSMISLLLLGIVIKTQLPTASYLILIPSIILSGIYLYQHLTRENKWISSILNYTGILVATAIWGPLLITLYLAFSIKLLFVPALMTFLICIALLTSFQSLWNEKSMLHSGIVLMVLGFVIAHAFSHPTEDKPLPSSVYYSFNKDSNEAYYLSNDHGLNFGNREVLDNAKWLRLNTPYPTQRIGQQTEIHTELLDSLVYMDTLTSSLAVLRSREEVFNTLVYIEDCSNLASCTYNGHEALVPSSNGGAIISELLGMTQDSLKIQLVKKDSSIVQDIVVKSMIRGMPEENEIPEGALRIDAYTEIIQTIRF